MQVIKQAVFLIGCIFALCYWAGDAKAETFDIVTFTTPKGWQKTVEKSAVQLGDDGAKGTCLITVFKTLPGSDNPKTNFATAWDTIVKGTLKVSGKPESQPTTKANGWTAESGFTPYESDGKKGLALLVTMSGNQKMVNILILTNTDAYQSEIGAFLESVSLPKLEEKKLPAGKPKQEMKAPPSAPLNSGFKFNTTNFDDGWTAIEQKDWARVTKGNVTVLVHYPNPKADAYNSVLKAELQNAWNLLVAPRYNNIRNFDLKPIQSYESISFAEADADEKATGKSVHVVLFKKHFSKGNGKYIEFVTGTKSDFEREFGAYHDTAFGWDKLVDMQGKNRFAVSGSDLSGKWSTQDYASLTYYYVNGGGFAGATATATADEFTFSKSGTYQSDHAGASGFVGNQKFSRQVYKGSFAATDWTLTLTNRFKGASEKYNCYFEAIKGGRILMLTDKQNTILSLVKQ